MLTVWIPLTDASPLNACMYPLPLHRDPDHPHNLADRSVGVDSLQNIRALPAGSGSLPGWTPMILHWGAHYSGHNVGARTSVAFYLKDGGSDLGGGVSVSENTCISFWYMPGAIAAMISLFDGSPLARDLRFPDSLKSVLKPYLDRVTQTVR